MKGLLLAALCVLGACGCGSGDPTVATPTPTATAPQAATEVAGPVAKTGACEPAPVSTEAPPAFTDIPDVPAETPYAVSHDGRIAAFFFVYPMRPKRPDGPNNKILWVVGDQAEAEPLSVVARSRGRTVRSAADGGGGSGQIQRGFHELPAPGCWRLHLRSGEIRTTLDVRVEP